MFSLLGIFRTIGSFGATVLGWVLEYFFGGQADLPSFMERIGLQSRPTGQVASYTKYWKQGFVVLCISLLFALPLVGGRIGHYVLQPSFRSTEDLLRGSGHTLSRACPPIMTLHREALRLVNRASEPGGVMRDSDAAQWVPAGEALCGGDVLALSVALNTTADARRECPQVMGCSNSEKRDYPVLETALTLPPAVSQEDRMDQALVVAMHILCSSIMDADELHPWAVGHWAVCRTLATPVGKDLTPAAARRVLDRAARPGAAGAHSVRGPGAPSSSQDSLDEANCMFGLNCVLRKLMRSLTVASLYFMMSNPLKLGLKAVGAMVAAFVWAAYFLYKEKAPGRARDELTTAAYLSSSYAITTMLMVLPRTILFVAYYVLFEIVHEGTLVRETQPEWDTNGAYIREVIEWVPRRCYRDIAEGEYGSLALGSLYAREATVLWRAMELHGPASLGVLASVAAHMFTHALLKWHVLGSILQLLFQPSLIRWLYDHPHAEDNDRTQVISHSLRLQAFLMGGLPLVGAVVDLVPPFLWLALPAAARAAMLAHPKVGAGLVLGLATGLFAGGLLVVDRLIPVDENGHNPKTGLILSTFGFMFVLVHTVTVQSFLPWITDTLVALYSCAHGLETTLECVVYSLWRSVRSIDTDVGVFYARQTVDSFTLGLSWIFSFAFSMMVFATIFHTNELLTRYHNSGGTGNVPGPDWGALFPGADN